MSLDHGPLLMLAGCTHLAWGVMPRGVVLLRALDVVRLSSWPLSSPQSSRNGKVSLRWSLHGVQEATKCTKNTDAASWYVQTLDEKYDEAIVEDC